MKYLSIAILLIVLPKIALGEWTYVDQEDAFTDERVRYTLYVDVKHRIQISREAESVWMYFSRKIPGTFEPDGKIELRVDDREAMVTDPESLKRLSEPLGERWYQWEPDTVGFLLWHGKEEEGCGYIGQLQTGNQLAFRYPVSSLERESFRITLRGAREALAQGLGLTLCGQ